MVKNAPKPSNLELRALAAPASTVSSGRSCPSKPPASIRPGAPGHMKRPGAPPRRAVAVSSAAVAVVAGSCLFSSAWTSCPYEGAREANLES